MSMGHFPSGVRRGGSMKAGVFLIFKILGKSQAQSKGEREDQMIQTEQNICVSFILTLDKFVIFILF